MEKNGDVRLQLRIFGVCVCFAAICLVQCDATKTINRYRAGKHFRDSSTKLPRKFHSFKKFDTYMPLDSSNTDPYVSSPFSMPPYESLPPFPLPENTPPYCVYPPFTPQPPSTIPSPVGGYTPMPPPGSNAPPLPGPTPIPPSPEGGATPGPPESTPLPNPPTIFPSPPGAVPNPPTNIPTPTEPVLSPPYYEPSPPGYVPGPPQTVPSPSGSFPSPRFLPPIIFPPPTVPPPPRRTPITAMWCVAKASVPDPIIQEAMNYACFSGADCDQIQPSGSCFQPNTLFAHASYAFNSYWQRTKVAGGSCDFGGTAILVTVDPSYDGCHFVYF